MRDTKHRPRESGLGLVEVMVASVIIILAGVGIAALVGRTFTVQRNLDRMGQLEIIRRELRTGFDCRRSLAISPVKRLPQSDACQRAPGKTLFILRRDGREIFPLHQSEEFYRVGDWHVRASCENSQVRFEGRINIANRARSESDQAFGSWRDIFSGTAMFCREYLSEALNQCADAQYPFQAGWDSRGALCCRVAEKSGPGLARASCTPFEILVAGGAMCGKDAASLGPVQVQRSVIKETLFGPGIGNTKPTTTTIAPPTVPHFVFPQADVIANIIGPWQSVNVSRGGFLAKSMPGTNDKTPNAGILNHWEAQCAADDYHDARKPEPSDNWLTRSIAVCCPRRL